ncbi:MAG: ABC transporter permease [Armatimonadota bacterium]|nr:ABC transporter permease [bacterium]MDW8103448.1 ABC transporter permease [Armatimonadota bacterium]MDW8289572.1 ABC transporter permease [Armatimonadota bacterium]
MTVPAVAGEVRSSRLAHAWRRALPPLLGVLLTLLVWHWWSLSRGSESILAAFSPAASAHSLWQLVATGALLPHILVSVKRVLVGLLIGTLVGVPLGILLGTQAWLERATAPVLQLVRMISPLSWMPIAIMVFGIGDAPVYFLVGIATLFPMMLNTRSAIAQVDRKWLLAVRSLGANRWEQLRYVYLPAILTQVLTGFRLAVGLAWVVLVPAEMLGVSAGLGYYILDTRDRLAYGEMMAVILVIGVLGYAFDLTARLLVARWTPHLRT